MRTFWKWWNKAMFAIGIIAIAWGLEQIYPPLATIYAGVLLVIGSILRSE